MNLEEPFLNGVGDSHRVLARLFGNNQRNRGLAIKSCFRARLFHTILGVTNVAEFDRISTAAADDEIIKLRGLNNAAHRSYGQLPRPLVYPATGKLHVLSANSVSHLRHRDIEGAQFVGINPHLNLARASTDYRHLAHTADRFDLLFDLLVGDVGNFSRRPRGRDGDSYDRRGIGVQLLHDGLLGGDRKIVNDQVNLVSDFLRRDVGTFFEQKGNENLGNAFDGSGTQFVDAADGVHGAFNLVGYLRLDFLWGSAGIHNGNRDGRQVNLREKIDAQRLVGKEPDNCQTQDQHRRKHRTPDTDFS